MAEFPFKPRIVGWELTLRCNMRCIHCGSSAGAARPGELSEEEGLSLIDQLAELGTEIVNLSGGEPLLHPSWPVWARRIVERGIKPHLITNGLLLERNLDTLRDVGLTRVGISMDGVEKTHDFIRNHPGSFAIAISAARAARQRGIGIGAVTHVSRANLADLEAMYELFSEIPLDFWQIQITFKLGRMRDHDAYSLDPEQLPEVVRFVHEKQCVKGRPEVAVGDNLGYFCEPSIRKHEWKGCFAGRHIMGIDADGSIKGCLSLPREFVEGNIRQEPLKAIWEDKNRFRYNRYFDETMLEGHCAGCPKGRQCRAGCTVTAHASTGRRFDNPYCALRVARERKG